MYFQSVYFMCADFSLIWKHLITDIGQIKLLKVYVYLELIIKQHRVTQKIILIVILQLI